MDEFQVESLRLQRRQVEATERLAKAAERAAVHIPPKTPWERFENWVNDWRGSIRQF